MEVPLKVWIVMGFIAFLICALTFLAINRAYSKKWDAVDPDAEEKSEET